MIDFRELEIWFVTGSQHLYGEETLKEVASHSQEITRGLANLPRTPVKVVAKPVLTTPESIRALCLEANHATPCIGLIVWMHTFSPAKMWIPGLKALQKPFVHLHTQYNRELPWSTIDMDFMNLNQAAHGDREFGFMVTRLRLNRKVVVGFWNDDDVRAELAVWARAACAWHDAQTMRVARFGDNMRNVAVTEGDKVEAEVRLGYTVRGFGIGDLSDRLAGISDAAVDKLTREYDDTYAVSEPLRLKGARRAALRDAARIELALRSFLADGGFTAFTDTFEDLHGLSQLPGIAVQRLMADGYGFGAEGDWKTAALVRSMKVMAAGLEGGTSFMEDYTYDLTNGQVLGAHMLEVCPSITEDKPAVEIHSLSIGGKADPVRLVFTSAPGAALNACLVDMGDRFRMVVNQVQVVTPKKKLPKLPVARALWVPEPNLKVAATAWIFAGGAHHTGFSRALIVDHLADFADMAAIEFIVIDRDTNIRAFKQELRWNELYYRLTNHN
jgi:L-arabinose isomerase